VVLAALPWRSDVLPRIPAFPGPGVALLVGCSLLTVLLLLSQYRVGGSPRLLALAWAYLWSAAAALQIAAATPGILRGHPALGADPNSVQWLWLSWHVVTPLLIGLALAPWPAGLERTLGARHGRMVRATISWVFVVVLSLVLALVLANAPRLLPTVTAEDGTGLTGGATASVIVLNLAAVALAVWGVGSRHSTEGVERWAVVASVAFLGDVWLTALSDAPFSVAFYLARILGLAATAFVMLAILRESARLQAKTYETALRLEEQNAELVEATRIRDHLAAVVSHDMRTPLAGLQGYLEMLREDDLDSALARRMLERSWMLTRRLTLLTEDMLAAATLEHGDLVVAPVQLDLDVQLGECATCFPDLDLELDCPPGLAAYADPLRLQQILANLVRNAQKHGAEPVRIAAGPDPRQPGGVVIRVSDAGPGVPATFVPRLFEPYTQGSSTATGGAGLGLSVVRDLVAAHHGETHYARDGNAFVLTLPGPPRTSDPAVCPPPRAADRAGVVRRPAVQT
jgi:signal transduction histidine kinase